MYWIAMGANDSRLGAWNQEDTCDIALANLSKEEKNKVATDIFVSRLENYGLHGYIKFIADKLTWIFGDVSFFYPIKLSASIDETKKDNLISNTILYNSVNYSYFIYFAQAVWIVILYLILKSFFMNIFSYTIKIDDILLITILGLLIFFTFWESRSRYIFNYAPIFIYTAVISLIRYYNKKITIKD